MDLGLTSLITLLIWLLILGIVVYGVYVILGMLSLPAPIKTLVYLIVAVIVLVILLNALGLTL